MFRSYDEECGATLRLDGEKVMLSLRPEGLYCENGDFYIDPVNPVKCALLTHAHGDHCRPGMGVYYGHKATCDLASIRLGDGARMHPLEYEQKLSFGPVSVSFHPAGHILGSAQIRLSCGGEVWVVSGDYKLQHDPSCPPMEAVACDTFITEATFGLPVFHWPKTSMVAGDINTWYENGVSENATSLLFAYSLGKSQRLILELLKANQKLANVMVVHRSCAALNAVYRHHGVQMPDLPVLGDDIPLKDCVGRLIIAPPTTEGARWTRGLKNKRSAMASGWMMLRGTQRRRPVDKGFVVSDHADWPGLLEAITRTKASRVLVTHGYEDSLSRYLNEKSISSSELKISYGGDEEGV